KHCKGIIMLRSIGPVAFLALLMVGCGGGGSSSTQPPPPASYTIGGTVSGLSGSGLVLQNIIQNTGALTPLTGFPVAAGSNAFSISIDSTNQFLYVTNEGGATVSGFRLDADSGALTPIPGAPSTSGSHPGFIAAF